MLIVKFTIVFCVNFVSSVKNTDTSKCDILMHCCRFHWPKISS